MVPYLLRSQAAPPTTDRLSTRALAHLVESRIGLHFSDQNWGGLKQGLDDALRALHTGSMEELFDLLEEAPTDGRPWQVVAEALTIGETFFFRHPAQLRLIIDTLLPRAMKARKGEGPLRLWSAGCSTGEEPFSLAILYADSELGRSGFPLEILATDLNPQSIEKARLGRFGAWAFRGVDPGLRATHFQSAGAQWEIADRHRTRVQFRIQNLLDPAQEASALHTRFDVILCRNVLIYHPSHVIQHILDLFAQALRPEGVLLLGLSDLGSLRPTGFKVDVQGDALALRPLEGEALRPASPLPIAPPLYTMPASSPRPPKPAASRPSAPPSQPSGPSTEAAWITHLNGLAEIGSRETLSQLETALQRFPRSSRLHYLRSLLLSDRGDQGGSFAALEKVLSLDPAFVVAHVDRARHLESLGNLPGAARAWEAAIQALRGLAPDQPAAGMEPVQVGEALAHCSAALERCLARAGRQR